MISTRVVNNSTLKCLFRRISLSNNDFKQISNNYNCATVQLTNKLLEPDWWHQTSRPIRSLSRQISTTTMSDGASSSGNQQGKRENRLALEHSPYLLQHATNPVDWYPWGQEAFDRAKNENKLIFLSVGYSTCHWCHVMEKESFENPEIAKIMNRYFINIKVDREERPDVDKLYMSFIQATQGGGGWPMSVFLTPTLEPLAGGTYFPPDDRYGRPGFKTVLINIGEQWLKQQKSIENSGKLTLEMLRKLVDNDKKSNDLKIPGDEVWKKCLLQLSHSYDKEFGGFSIQPKFPQPCNFNFLFHVYSRDKNSEQGQYCLEMCLNTLNKMAYGGIHDHVNCGFARYSVDNKWHVPHFEKMLYDQAQLSISYADAYVLTKNQFYSEILQDILTYVSRDLSHKLGGFYGAEDADSYPFDGAEHKQEGAFCVWESQQIQQLLNGLNYDKFDYFDLFKYHYNVRESGNVAPSQDPHGELKNKNVLVCYGTYEQTGEKFGITVDQVKEILQECHKILYDERQKRPKPHVDTKIVTSWNGLMISGYAKGGFVLKQQQYIDRAILAANFIKKHLYNVDNKTLLRCCYRGDNDEIVQTSTPIVGFLDDYAFLIRGLLDLYEASLDADWLSWAEQLQEQQNLLFWDKENFGYFTSPENDSTILIRGKEDQDGAEPCGNSVSVHNLIRLAAYLDRQDLRTKAGQILSVFSERLQSIPIALPEMASALLFYQNTPTQVFIAGKTEDNNTQALLDVVRSRYIPGRILAVADGPYGRAGLLYSRHETLNRIRPIHGKSAAYVCRNFACSLPVTEPDQLADSLDSNEHN